MRRSGASVQACWFFCFFLLPSSSLDTPSCAAAQPLPALALVPSLPGAAPAGWGGCRGSLPSWSRSLGCTGRPHPRLQQWAVSHSGLGRRSDAHSPVLRPLGSLSPRCPLHTGFWALEGLDFFFFNVYFPQGLVAPLRSHKYGIFSVFSTCVVNLAFFRHAAP